MVRPRIVLAFVVVALSFCIASYGGDLNPPVGPVGPTGKTLVAVEPRIAIGAANTPGDANSLFRISQPGSYYLTGDITGVSGLHGIEIGASDVSIDLMGFALRGVAGALDGITGDAAPVNNIRVAGGVVRDWGGDGIDLSIGVNHHVRDIQAVGNGARGITCDGNALVESCTASGNTGSDGIACLGSSSVVRGCAASNNGQHGIILNFGGVVRDSSAFLNGGSGILSGDGVVIAHCKSDFNTLDGISTGGQSTVSNCSVTGNGDDGIGVFFRAKVSACIAQFNTGNGIEANSNSLITHNVCSNNGTGGVGAGVAASGVRNRIEDNSCTENDHGLNVSGFGNLILRNSATTNATNYTIAAGNRYGPIINLTSGTPPAVSGNSAADTSGTTHPWANFAH